MIRIMSLSSIDAAREVFGYSFGIGTRNYPPRKGAPHKVLELGNKINFVKVSAVQHGDTFHESIPSERIDLVYEELTRNLSIRVKYRSTLAESPEVSQILRFAQPLVHQPEIDPLPVHPRRRVRAIALGTSFLYNDKLVRVVTSDGNSVSAISEVDGEEIFMSNGELMDIIMNNIG
jgi:hypothetical protein